MGQRIGQNAFAIPANNFEFGSASRYISDFRQPPIFRDNFSVVKRFNMFEVREVPVRTTIRADFFNAFNRTNFRVNGSVGNANFGRATTPQQGPRLITMGLRVEF